MNIHEAAKHAVESGKFIKRQSMIWMRSKLKLTNTSELCCIIVSEKEERRPYRRWEPSCEDLIADDWIVTD